MIELVYDAETAPLIRKRFPNARIEDASDFIHESRIEVELPDEERAVFYKHAIREGFAEACLGFQLWMRGTKEEQDEIRKWLAELRAEREAGANAS